MPTIAVVKAKSNEVVELLAEIHAGGPTVAIRGIFRLLNEVK